MENRDLQAELAAEKEKSAHWICKHTAAEQKYQTQSNVIAELRGRAIMAEEREQKLKEAIKEALKWTWYHGEANMLEIENGLEGTLDTLYPLDKEESTNV
ncbi:hypothetical protein [Paenibacillus macquariensis]|uniref:Uncharacterized protein n=1 Tax=Paenibacillus macquariensis TaxID=948756 RepID=A0ABY1JX85_9BACL|nr:hypothetical protein [Paenibacillus macquariensis]MEC0089354.1 hypothetical protein [Paenibacillus macquariensis]OAB33248.1 hypothetical protein PMSM_14635 [Paenibacillus macquariensis subsp. macquariensis]SIQ93163.1 hypothetical protein SAMN05421578_105104 [Paenibacillus macquariensis]